MTSGLGSEGGTAPVVTRNQRREGNPNCILPLAVWLFLAVVAFPGVPPAAAYSGVLPMMTAWLADEGESDRENILPSLPHTVLLTSVVVHFEIWPLAASACAREHILAGRSVDRGHMESLRAAFKERLSTRTVTSIRARSHPEGTSECALPPYEVGHVLGPSRGNSIRHAPL